MSSMIQPNYGTRSYSPLTTARETKLTGTQGSSFLDLAAQASRSRTDTLASVWSAGQVQAGSTDSGTIKYPGDVTISYPPNLSNISVDSSISTKSKDEMTLDEYKQWVMNEISKMPVSDWARSTYSSGSIIIKEEAFEAMKNDPDYEKYVLNRVRSACSVQGLPGCSNYVGYDVIGASPEECHGYAGPIGNASAFSSSDDSDDFWTQRIERHKKYMELQQEAAARRRLMMKLHMNGGSVSAAELLMGLL